MAVRLRGLRASARVFGVPWNASLPIWRYRRSGRLLQPASPRAAPTYGAGSKRGSQRFPGFGQCPAGGHAALQDGVRGRATVMDSQFFPIYYRTLGFRVRSLSPDARYPAFRADSGDYLALEGEFETLVVRYGNISKIFFDSITVSEETGRCGRASPRDRLLARRRGAGMRGDPLRTWRTADRRSYRARFAGRAPRACRRAGRTPRSSSKRMPDLRKVESEN